MRSKDRFSLDHHDVPPVPPGDSDRQPAGVSLAARRRTGTALKLNRGLKLERSSSLPRQLVDPAVRSSSPSQSLRLAGTTRTRTQMKMLREIPDNSIDSDVPSGASTG